MKALDLLATEENIYTTFIDDAIGRDADVFSFVSFLNSLDSGTVIALNARWGEGKTFFVKQTKLVLEAFNPYYENIEHREEIKKTWEKLRKKQEIEIQPFVTVYYDAWMNDNDEDPVLSLVLAILQEIDGLTSLENERGIMDLAGNVLDCFTGRTVKGVLDSLRGTPPLENIKKAKDLESKIAEFFESILPERGNRMVVFIDELDRCKPDYAIRLLERIKHYFGNERITFVFSLNMDELQHTIRNFYGNDFDACRYLERFFDFRIELPKPDMRRFYDDIGLENGSWVYESVCKQVVEMFNMGLREIAKFYRVAKTVAYKPTHKEHDQWLFIFSDGAGRRFCCLCIVPLMIGLSMCDRPRYNKFIQGRDGSPLIELLSDTNIAISMCSQLLNEKEAYSNLDNSSELIVVKREDKLREVYNAIFVKKYDGRSYETTIGKVSFGEETKNELLKIISGLTEYADYEI